MPASPNISTTHHRPLCKEQVQRHAGPTRLSKFLWIGHICREPANNSIIPCQSMTERFEKFRPDPGNACVRQWTHAKRIQCRWIGWLQRPRWMPGPDATSPQTDILVNCPKVLRRHPQYHTETVPNESPFHRPRGAIDTRQQQLQREHTQEGDRRGVPFHSHKWIPVTILDRGRLPTEERATISPTLIARTGLGEY